MHLGHASLVKYGEAFGFNGDIDFEVSLPSSMFEVTDDSYHLAEIACGFNRTTTLTPFHGALIAAAVLNDGRIPEPTMIEQIIDENGREIYRSRPAVAGEAMSSRASELLVNLMTRTVSSGTCRKTFRSVSKDRVLSRLVIGGKTGSIDNREHTRRMDWFIGFARDKNGSEGIAVAVVVGHGKYIGTRAADFAKHAFRDYFTAYFSAADEENNQAG
jgi:cell division protein FtsI/penicillin-binding protein 2